MGQPLTGASRKARRLATAIACGGAFLLIGVLAKSDWLTRLETGWLGAVAGWRSPPLTQVMQRVSWLGTAWFELPFVLLVLVMLGMRRRTAEAMRYFLWGLGGWALYAVLKLGFHRARPRGVPRLSGAGWHSFPSGHAMLAPILFVFAAVLLTAEPAGRRFRVPALALAWLTCLVLAFSRVYLGVHYPSDVVAGLLAGSAWLALSLAYTDAQSRVGED